MKKYEIRHKETNRKGYIWSEDSGYGTKYYVSWRGEGFYGGETDLKDWEWNIDKFAKEWDIPRSVKLKLLWPEIAAKIAVRIGVIMAIMAIAAAILVPLCFTWDYHTGQDTGYISAVDKMTLSDDATIYIRRRPLDAAGYGYAEKDETAYCTTADRQEVIDRAYEAMTNGKRVVLVYDTPKPFGWRAIDHCNSAPITDIKYVEE